MRYDLKLFIIGLVFLVLFPSAILAASFEYLYVEASEGNSSGGHSAIEFGDEVYHFQHHDSGLIRLLRQDKQEFHFQYRFLQNRRIHLSHIEITDDTFTRLRSYFKLQFLAQNQQFNQLNQLHKDRLLLRRLLYKTNQDNNFLDADFATDLQLKGAGLFFAEQQLGSQDTLSSTIKIFAFFNVESIIIYFFWCAPILNFNMLFNGFQKLNDIQWFCQIIHCTGFHQFFNLKRHGIGTDDDYRNCFCVGICQ